jgi:DNA-binding NarL/FixJ family response regulator
MEVLSLVAEGRSSASIAQRLGVARSTIESQIRSGMRKLGASTRLEAAVTLRRMAGETMVERPLIVVEDDTLLDAAERLLAAAGWTVRRGFDPQGAVRDGRAIACVGPVGTEEDSAAAVLCAFRGHAIAAKPVGSEQCVLLLDDLARVGRVRVSDRRTAPPAAGLGDEELDLLLLIGSGLGVSAAAAACRVSRRTAARRVATAQATMAVTTMAAALMTVGATLSDLAPPAPVC